jgi:hypothetical protein
MDPLKYPAISFKKPAGVDPSLKGTLSGFVKETPESILPLKMK